MDPAMGVVGGLVILRWSAGLLRSSGAVLLDAGSGDALPETIRKAVESDGDSRVADLRVWPLGSGDMAALLTVVTGAARPASDYRDRLKDILGLAALHVEVHPCADPACACPKVPSAAP
jgi:Co/Zn/Cd efflux system component